MRLIDKKKKSHIISQLIRVDPTPLWPSAKDQGWKQDAYQQIIRVKPHTDNPCHSTNDSLIISDNHTEPAQSPALQKRRTSPSYAAAKEALFPFTAFSITPSSMTTLCRIENMTKVLRALIRQDQDPGLGKVVCMYL